ncbi:ferredoxin [Burkholderia sp. THE68]|jgi:predicted molibdopterin-dependent oxidoreductase YjgC|uniref:2Fe-2S iron-sulfur cluster-binding protein n=1 Tax=Burkholderiaceae TaxID=119060 RepID=UPI0013161449|nr:MULTISPECIES: 2Fe-2S iron-sulfur cluster-binding protein [Burkholderiaceae]BBU29407.1 ferredoxin [Burkholderia sp. THE68]BCQ25247.1 (2Fe-2S)-binding protein [Caballeronia sp. NK8]
MADLVTVTVDGEPLAVPAFTTVAAAIAIAMRGVGGTRRSVTGEPRAAWCGMGVCQECRVTVDGRAHVLGCQTPCRDGLSIETMR